LLLAAIAVVSALPDGPGTTHQGKPEVFANLDAATQDKIKQGWYHSRRLYTEDMLPGLGRPPDRKTRIRHRGPAVRSLGCTILLRSFKTGSGLAAIIASIFKNLVDPYLPGIPR